MADECDRAQEIETMYRRAAIEGHRRTGCGASRKYCEECGEAIPEARRVAVPGVRLCLACQEEADVRDR